VLSKDRNVPGGRRCVVLEVSYAALVAGALSRDGGCSLEYAHRGRHGQRGARSRLATVPAKPDVAVLVPCFNEAATIAKVVSDFYAALPECRVFVYDNRSTDGTAAIAAKAGAIVRYEPLPGKGNVVRSMFADVEADVYVLVDGDDAYDASYAPQLIELLLNESLDLVTAARDEVSTAAYRRGHRLGNRLLTSLVAALFGNRFTDRLSGFRAISRRLVKSFPLLSAGFEIETELTVHALQLRVPIAEVVTPYRNRPEGSVSKLHTYQDGFRIITAIARLVKEERPMYFFGVMAALLPPLATCWSCWGKTRPTSWHHMIRRCPGSTIWPS
jgi:glycosyltransferase involved in cell wall biosynthesis